MFDDVEAGLRICEFTGATIGADAIALMQKQRVNRRLAARYGYDT